jgi:hypothetical protein
MNNTVLIIATKQIQDEVKIGGNINNDSEKNKS